MELLFKGFKAIDDYEKCIGFLNGHVNVLKDYGITNITTNNHEWMKNPNIYCVVAIDKENCEIVGGIRIQISEEGTLLPVEAAVGYMDNEIYKIVERFRNDGGVAELCALWNAKRVAGKGISTLLTRASIAACIQLDFKTLMGICAEYTLNMFYRVGFRVNPNLGNNGKFPYPNENYIAQVLGILNAKTLDTSHPYDKERMLSLRSDLTQTYVENEGKCDVKVEYSLIF